MDLSFDKLLEQFDLKRNEHQKNMHKVNKRIDEIESHMEEIKKQLHNFDHQIVNIEKELKTTLSMMNNENDESSHHNMDRNRGDHEQRIYQKHQEHEHNQHHEQNEHHKQDEHQRHHEQHRDHHNWAENLINNVEEFSASIFEPNNEGHKGFEDDDGHKGPEDHKSHNEEKQNNSRVANRKKHTNQNIDNINEFSASIMDENDSAYSNLGVTSINHKNYSELSSSNINHDYEEHQNTNHHNKHDKTSSHKTSEQLLETNFSDLSIDDWEDSTTNLSMSEWFEVDPNEER